MPVTTISLVEALEQYRLLDAQQLAAVRADLAPRFPESRDLARELIQRGWLTPFQVNHLLNGTGASLLLGSYLLLERLGQGGMGEVFRARNWKLGKIVALKVIRKEKLSRPDAVRRFQREVRAAAQLSHPNVVHAFDADQVGDLHMLVMEYVEGVDLHKIVKDHGPLPVGQACDCIRQTALGLQHAFERGLVHRDIKPHNLLVGNAGTPAAGVVKILDMGLARIEQTAGDDSTAGMTQDGIVVGTPDYIAPEQVTGASSVDIRADLYSLGCTLYYLLAGRPPFAGGSYGQKLMCHQTAEPPAVDSLRPEVPAGVAAIVRKLMAKLPEHRFQTPAELAAVLSGDLSDIPSGATPPPSGVTAIPTATPVGVDETSSGWSRIDAVPAPPSRGTSAWGMQKAVRERHWRRWVVAGAISLLTGFAFLGVVIYRQVDGKSSIVSTTSTAAGRPEGVLVQVDAAKPWQDSGIDILAGQDISFSATGTWLQKGQANWASPKGLELARRERTLVPEAPAMCLLGRIGSDEPFAIGAGTNLTPTQAGRLFVQANDLDLSGNSGSLKLYVQGGTVGNKSAPRPQPARLERAEAELIRLQAREADAIPMIRDALRTEILAFCQTYRGTLQAARAQALLARLPSPLDRLEAGAIPVYERNAAAAHPGFPQNLLVAVLGESRLKHWRPVYSVAFSPDGKSVASAGFDRAVNIWDATTGNGIRGLLGHREGVWSVAFNSNGKLIASGGQDGTVKIWDAATGRELRTIEAHKSFVRQVAFNSTRKQLATASADGTAKIWSLRGDPLHVLEVNGGLVGAVAFSPDGTLVATGSHDGSARLWEADSGLLVRKMNGNRAHANAVAFSPDGQTLAVGNHNNTVTLWAVPTGKEIRTLTGHGMHLMGVAFSPDGRTLASASYDQTVKLWDVASGKELASLQHFAPALAVAFRSDGAMLATSGDDGVVRLWNTTNWKELLTTAQHRSTISSLAFNADGTLLASGSDDRTVKLWDTATAKEVRTLTDGQAAINSVAFGADGRTLAAGNKGGKITLWATASGAEVRAIAPPGWNFQNIALSLDGKLLAAPGSQGLTRLWEPATGKELATLPGDGVAHATAAVFFPGSRQLVTSYTNGNLKFWEAPSGKLVRSQNDKGAMVISLAVSSDGRLLAAGSIDGSVKLWDALTGRDLQTLKVPGGQVWSLAFRPDGEQLAVAGDDGTVRLYDAASGAEKAHGHIGRGPIRQVAFSPDGRHLATANSNGTIYIFRLAPLPVRKN
jgi:WD40 repeat protein/serine/threonine protein kinase